MRKPTFCQKNTKSEKFAQSRILHSLKALGARIRINLVVLGARTQDSENSGSSDQEIGAFGLKMILRRVIAVRKLHKDEKICNILLPKPDFLLFWVVLAEDDI